MRRNRYIEYRKGGFHEGIIHKKLVSHDIGIIENLNSNLRRFVDKRIFLFAYGYYLKI